MWTRSMSTYLEPESNVPGSTQHSPSSSYPEEISLSGRMLWIGCPEDRQPEIGRGRNGKF